MFKEFSNEDTELIKSIIEDAEIINEETLEVMKELREKSICDDYNLGILFLKCHNYFDMNSDLFKDEEKDLTDKIRTYLKKFDIIELRSIVSNYGDGKEMGSYILRNKIANIINKEREEYNNLINLFFTIFSGED